MSDSSLIETRNKGSRRLWEQSCRCIVGGGQAHKRPVDIMKLGGPSFAARGKGARFWDVDGNEYLDYLLAYGPIVLGHCDPDVNEFVKADRRPQPGRPRDRDSGQVHRLLSHARAQGDR